MSAADVMQWAEKHFCASHEGDGVVHGHTWVVRAYWPYAGADIRDRVERLATWVAKVDHTILPPTLTRSEELAAWFGVAVDAARVDVWREREGCGATWRA
jgi:hypothetical protein